MHYRSLAFAMLSSSIVALVPIAETHAAEVRAVEFYHSGFGHYFVTAHATEIAALDQDNPKGWSRTGQRYRVEDTARPDFAPVCRFTTSAFAGKASHFFTATAAECEAVKGNPDWTYEGIAFHVRLPDEQDACPANAAAVLRLYNNGLGGAPNHAYTSDPAKAKLLADHGWIKERTAWCVPVATADPSAKLLQIAGQTWEFPETYWTGGQVSATFRKELVSTASLADDLRRFGFPSAAVGLYWGSENDLWWGPAIFDPVAGSYLLAGGPKLFEDQGTAWTADDLQGSSQPVCEHWEKRNMISELPQVRHPTQPVLWSACKPGSARLRP